MKKRTPPITEIMDRLDKEYPNQAPLLHYKTPFQLLTAVPLSARTTDNAVNKVTPELFRRWPTPEALAGAAPSDLEETLHSLGFFRQKARNLIGAAKTLVEKFDGKVPMEMEHLVSLPGIGRKSANVIRGHLWNLPGIIVDTHFGRVCRRLGLTKAVEPVQLEREILKIVAEDRQLSFSMGANLHGRRFCTSRKPNCTECILSDLCPKRI